MEKILRVCKQLEGESYMNAICIKGKWLDKFGFAEGELVRVVAEPDRITIERTKATKVLSGMNRQNKNVHKLVEGLGLKIA